MAVKESIALFFKEGSSDKVYQSSIEENKDGFTVHFAYGRRGNTLTTGLKTSKPLTYEAAKKIFDKLIAEKTAKGYTVDGTGTPYSNTDKETRDSGFRCQLLNAIDEDEAKQLIKDPEWWGQEKYDGKRMSVHVTKDGSVSGRNRKGLSIGLPQKMVECLSRLCSDYTLDGEVVGDIYHVFDCLNFGGVDKSADPYSKRLEYLSWILTPEIVVHTRFIRETPTIMVAHTAQTISEKQEMLDRLKANGSEGMVFKKHSAPYTSGRPNSGGNQRKFKFYSTASVIVAEHTSGKRSVSVELLDGKKHVPVGNVTILPNFEVPPKGAIVEVKYLYAYPGGSLYQPIYLGERDDIDKKDCALSQLKYKKVNDEEEES